MQHNKNTKRVEQIEKVSNNDQKIVDSISDVIKKFNVNTVFNNTPLIFQLAILPNHKASQ